MRRLFWFGLGAATGAWATHRLRRFARSWTPQGLAVRATGLSGRLRLYAEEIRAEARAREVELRETLGLTDGVPRPREEWRGDRPARALAANRQNLDEDKDGH